MTILAGDKLQLSEVLGDVVNDTYTINSYESISQRTLTIDGETGEWLQLKNTSQETRAQRPLLFYSPEKRVWLKITNPDDYAIETSDQTLLLSCEIGATALREVGLDTLADQFKPIKVIIDGKVVNGFVSPHVGATLEFFMQANASSRSENANHLYGQVYKLAFEQAVNLYIKFGYWRSDPNPGNIALRRLDNGGIQVCLIDFGDPPQEMPNQLGDRFVISDRKRENRSFQLRRLASLHEEFREQCAIHEIPFEVDLEEVLDNVLSAF